MPNTRHANFDMPVVATAETSADAHARIALEQSAMYSTRLAVARWTSSVPYPQMQVKAALRMSARARWYADAQQNFQAWLERGGFSQADAGPAIPGTDIRHEDACVD
jgi:hypothetical protein